MTIDVVSNSPLRRPPSDYAPAGAQGWFTIGSGFDAGKRLFYFDHTTSGGAPEATVLFVHGNPECSYTYRHVRDALIASGRPMRLVAADNIGFGLSDQATFEMVDMHHASNLAQLIESLDLTNVTLVLHDWGGPIGVGAMLERMDRVTRLIVLNTTIFPMPPDGWTYTNWPLTAAPWCKWPDLVPDSVWGAIATVAVTGPPGGFTPRAVALGAANTVGFLLRRTPEDAPAAVFREALRGRANTRSSKRNVRQTPVWGHGYQYNDPVHGPQDNSEFYRRMQTEVVRHWADLPAVAHFGRLDPLGKESVIAQWVEAIPGLVVHRYPRDGHFIEEARGTEIADSILRLQD